MQSSSLGEEDLKSVVEWTSGFSGSDLTSLCKDAAMGPVREVPAAQLATLPADQ